MKCSLLILFSLIILTGCNSDSAPAETPAPIATESATEETSNEGITRDFLEEIALETTSDAEVLNCISQAEQRAENTRFRDGDEIPGGSLISIDLDAIYTSWTEYPLKPICYKNNWGLFESARAFEAPHRGSYWIINE